MAINQPPHQLGLDTNILRHPTPRRFFLSFMEHIGAQAHLSKTVQEQIIWEVAREEETQRDAFLHGSPVGGVGNAQQRIWRSHPLMGKAGDF